MMHVSCLEQFGQQVRTEHTVVHINPLCCPRPPSWLTILLSVPSSLRRDLEPPQALPSVLHITQFLRLPSPVATAAFPAASASTSSDPRWPLVLLLPLSPHSPHP